MKYEEGEMVVYYNRGHKWHLMNFKAYPSKWTMDAYRLKYGDREIVADVSEIRALSEINGLMQAEPYVPRYSNDDDGMYSEVFSLGTVTSEEIHKAYGYGLDQLGSKVNVFRNKFVDDTDETDVDFRQRIIDQLISNV